MLNSMEANFELRFEGSAEPAQGASVGWCRQIIRVLRMSKQSPYMSSLVHFFHILYIHPPSPDVGLWDLTIAKLVHAGWVSLPRWRACIRWLHDLLPMVSSKVWMILGLVAIIPCKWFLKFFLIAFVFWLLWNVAVLLQPVYRTMLPACSGDEWCGQGVCLFALLLLLLF